MWFMCFFNQAKIIYTCSFNFGKALILHVFCVEKTLIEILKYLKEPYSFKKSMLSKAE